MNDTEDQRAAWNGHSGKVWVESQELLDRVLQPFEDALFEAELGRRVLDVGCGTGSATIRAGRESVAVGIDISAPMLARARERAEAANVPAVFIEADATTYELDAFDTVISRFGVMFFEDPVRAFRNLRRTGGALRAVAWRSPAENEFMTTAERAVAALLPALPPRRPNAPGQFAFGSRDRVIDILRASEWRDLDVALLDVTCSMPASALIPYATRLGPVGRVFEESDAATRALVTEKLEAAFSRFVAGDEVRFPAAGWLITAR